MLIEDNKSIVYVLSNPSMPGLLKIGETSREVETRVAELNRSTSIPTNFIIERSYEVNNSRSVEKQLHDLFTEHKVGKEFFQLSVKEIDHAMGVESFDDDLTDSLFDLQSTIVNIIERINKFTTKNQSEIENSLFINDVYACIENVHL